MPRLIDMARKFHDAKQDLYPFVAADTANSFAALMAAPSCVVLVSDRGFICGALVPSPSNASWVTAFEMFWWAEDRNGLRLLKAFEDWAKENGANEVKPSHPVNETRVAQLFERRGFTPTETVYTKVI